MYITVYETYGCTQICADWCRVLFMHIITSFFAHIYEKTMQWSFYTFSRSETVQTNDFTTMFCFVENVKPVCVLIYYYLCIIEASVGQR